MSAPLLVQAGAARQVRTVGVRPESRWCHRLLSRQISSPDPGNHHGRHHDPAAPRRQPRHHDLPHVSRHREVFGL